MPNRHLRLALVLAALAGCDDGMPSVVAPTPGPAPVLASPNIAVGTTAGTAITYDASKGGTTFGNATAGTVRYAITFLTAANGLTASGATVTGTCTAPGVTRAVLTVSDSLGRSAADTFAIVAFAPGLALPTLPVTPFTYADADVPLPAHYRLPVNGVTAVSADNSPADNAITNAGAALGRVLFYDQRLSANDGLACAGCHSAFVGYSDTPQRSVGFAGGLTNRYSPALVNARFYARGRFYRDERAATLEAQVLRPIQDGNEMGMSLDVLVVKLSATAYYAPLFASAFGTTTVTSDRIARALAQYVRSLSSTNSRYDRAFSATGVANLASVLTPREIEGEQLFRTTGCAACHTTVAMINDAPANIGLDAVTADTGAGRGRFKSPSLRNVALRPRFMHDGRFTSLEQVVDFYDGGVQPNPDLDPRLRAAGGAPKRLNLTAGQKSALIAFLQTLSDSTFFTTPRFANPFAPVVMPTVPPVAPTVPTAAVTMRATAFQPNSLSVLPGTVVTWTNLDNARHSASFTTAGVGATPIFTSGSQSLTMPSVAGTYAYRCAVHGAGMSGTVTVR